jgi:hypothetical protein
LFISVRVFSSCMYLCSIIFICACVVFLFIHLFNSFYLYVCFPLVCTFVQLFLSVRLFPLICTFVQLLFNCFYLCVCFPLVCTLQLNKCTNKKTTHAQIKIIEQRYIQEENTRTDKNKRTKAQTRGKHTHILFLSVRLFSSCLYLCSIVCICACVFLLFVSLFNCFYMCVCFPLVCAFVLLFLSVRVFSSCMYLCSIIFICACVTMEQRYKQEEYTGTDTNNWTKVQTRGQQTHR